jgi:methionyl-tRNA formyltransferase
VQKCLFLGYRNPETKLISFIKKKGLSVKSLKRKIFLKDVKNKDLIIAFGYRHIIDKKIISNLKHPIINLHISLLPNNRGAHPNFWSLVENKKTGVTIHEIDNGVDTGPIIAQKKIKFNIKLKNQDTFKKTYKILIRNIENLFKENFEKILNHNYSTKKQPNNKYVVHKKKDLPVFLKNWSTNIIKFKKLYSLAKES